MPRNQLKEEEKNIKRDTMRGAAVVVGHDSRNLVCLMIFSYIILKYIRKGQDCGV